MSTDASPAAEVSQLRDQVSQLASDKRQLIGELDSFRTRVKQLEEMLRLYRLKQFGPSSEQVPPEQTRLFDEAESEEPTEDLAEVEVRAHRKRTRRPRLSADLPRVDVIHDLDEADKVCPQHGCALQPMGEDTSEQLEFIPAQVRVLRHVCKKYRCPDCEGRLLTAAKPPQPIPKSIATASLLAFIVVSKYLDGLPLYRQCQIFSRIGFEADRTTLANWMIACGQLIQPLINLLLERLQSAAYVHLDETTVQVLAEPGRAAQTKSYMWVSVAGPPNSRTVLFHYAPSRSGQVARELLGQYTGTIMVDGYEGYEPVCHERDLLRLGCWAHARRKFVDAQRIQGQGKSGKADLALSYIGKLYQVERSTKGKPVSERYATRQQRSRPVVEQLRRWLDKTLPRTVPKTTLGKALNYLDSQWPRLIRYLDDGRWPIDNNPAENAIRPFVVGRKAWLFSQSTRGASASANLYSLIETAKGHGLEPLNYLNRVFTALPAAKSLADVEALLPENFKKGPG